VSITRSALATRFRTGNPWPKLDCGVCAATNSVVATLARAVHKMDSQLRFQKAIEAAPLLCNKHVTEICREGTPAHFIEVQRHKLEQLISDLAQAELRREEELPSLIARSVEHLSHPSSSADLIGQDSDSVAESEADPVDEVPKEFASWDEARRLAYLARLESEAASLRYRNAVLSEENRRFKLAQVAWDATRRDLERDRAELIAEKRASQTPKTDSQD
jgi:hypothetical protein